MWRPFLLASVWFTLQFCCGLLRCTCLCVVLSSFLLFRLWLRLFVLLCFVARFSVLPFPSFVWRLLDVREFDMFCSVPHVDALFFPAAICCLFAPSLFYVALFRFTYCCVALHFFLLACVCLLWFCSVLFRFTMLWCVLSFFLLSCLRCCCFVSFHLLRCCSFLLYYVLCVPS